MIRSRCGAGVNAGAAVIKQISRAGGEEQIKEVGNR